MELPHGFRQHPRSIGRCTLAVEKTVKWRQRTIQRLPGRERLNLWRDEGDEGDCSIEIRLVFLLDPVCNPAEQDGLTDMFDVASSESSREDPLQVVSLHLRFNRLEVGDQRHAACGRAAACPVAIQLDHAAFDIGVVLQSFRVDALNPLGQLGFAQAALRGLQAIIGRHRASWAAEFLLRKGEVHDGKACGHADDPQDHAGCE